ncbi:hypothetical protein BSF42_22790 [Flavobacterium sp. ACN6]|nr:hypothetical protein BSF42_22790 [Flavobacterium sp. ACN6]
MEVSLIYYLERLFYDYSSNKAGNNFLISYIFLCF